MKRRSLSLPFVLTAALTPLLAFGDTTVKPKLPHASNPDNVMRNPDGTCWEHQNTACPPNVHCNPGPPRQVECPPENKKPK